MTIQQYARSNRAIVGDAMGPVALNPDGVGRRQVFQNGMIYEHASRGALGFIPRGAVLQLWRRNEYEHGYLGYPVSAGQPRIDPHAVPFEGGVITTTQGRSRSLRFAYLNTQLIVDLPTPIKNPYRGRGRARQVNRLIEILRARATEVDVVVLAELMNYGERTRVSAALRSSYPHQLSGPDEADFVEQDGGLLLMSKYPFAVTNRLIYRVAAGWDALSNKGILHARVVVPGGSVGEVDVYASHLQAGHQDVKERQAQILASFVASISERRIPAVVLADYNLDFNAANSSQSNALLGHPFDGWREARWHAGDLGITSDEASCYERGALAMDSPRRYVRGKRIDAAMLYPADRAALEAAAMEVDAFELAPGSGVDLSDHYGITVTVQPVRAAVRIDRRVTAARFWVSRVHCLQTTAGLGEDEVYFTLWASADGAAGGSRKSDIVGMGHGEIWQVPRPEDGGVLVAPRGGLAAVDLRVRLKEEDFGTDDTMGDRTIRVGVDRLLLSAAPNRTHELTMPLFTGEGGRYAVHISYALSTG